MSVMPKRLFQMPLTHLSESLLPILRHMLAQWQTAVAVEAALPICLQQPNKRCCWDRVYVGINLMCLCWQLRVLFSCCCCDRLRLL
jgi:hypothetical protein